MRETWMFFALSETQMKGKVVELFSSIHEVKFRVSEKTNEGKGSEIENELQDHVKE